MKIFYDVIGGFHNVSGEFLPASISVEIHTNGGKKLSRGDLFLPIIWGSPTIIYTTFSVTHGTSYYYNWSKEVDEFVNKLLVEAVTVMKEEGLQDTEPTLVTWLEPVWVPNVFKSVNNNSFAYSMNKSLTPLSELAKEKGHVMDSIDTDGRLDFMITAYYESFKRLV